MPGGVVGVHFALRVASREAEFEQKKRLTKEAACWSVQLISLFRCRQDKTTKAAPWFMCGIITIEMISVLDMRLFYAKAATPSIHSRSTRRCRLARPDGGHNGADQRDATEYGHEDHGAAVTCHETLVEHGHDFGRQV